MLGNSGKTKWISQAADAGNPWLLAAAYEQTGCCAIFPVHKQVGFVYIQQVSYY